MADKVPPDFSEIHKSFDSLVNALNEDTSAIKDLPDNMASAMNNNKSSFDKSIEDLVKIMSALTGLNESVLKSSQDAQKYFKDLAKSANDANKDRQKQEKSSEKSSQDLLGAVERVGENVNDMNKNLEKSISGFAEVNNKNFDDTMALTKAIGYKPSTSTQAQAGAAEVAAGVANPPPPDFGKGRFEFDDNDFFKRQGNQLTSYLAQLTGGVGLTQVLFTGAAKDAFIFQAALREVAFETQGITGDTRDLQVAFGKYGDVVEATGKNVDEFQNEYLKNLKKGTKANQSGLKVIKSGLAASTLIGSSTEATADLFGEWNRTLGLSERQMQQLSRDSLSVSRSTGVTGDELVNAMNASKKILENLRNQGNLTSLAMKNVIGMSAEAQKVGVGDAYMKIANALSSTNSLLESTSDATGGYLLSVGAAIGKTGTMLEGTFMQSRKNLGSLASGMEGTLKRLTGDVGMTFEQIGNLSVKERQRLSIQLKGLTGMELTEFQRVGETFRKQSRGIAGTLKDLEDEMKNTNMTAEERVKAEADYANALSNQGLAASTAFDKSLKAIDPNAFGSKMKAFESATGSFVDDLKQSGNLGEFREDLSAAIGGLASKDVGIEINGQKITQDVLKGLDPINNAGDAALMMGAQQLAAAESLKLAAEKNKIDLKDMGLDADFSSKLKKAIESGDTLRIREINDEMSTAAQKMGVDLKKGTSPTSELSNALNKLNQTIRNLTSGPLMMFLDMLGGMGLLLTILGGTAVAAGFGLYQSAKMFSLGSAALTKGLSAMGLKKQALAVHKNSKTINRAVGSVEKSVGNAAANIKTGTRSIFEPFTKGFSRARSQGQGFFKSLDRGLGGLIQSSNKTRGLMKLPSAVYNTFDSVGKGITQITNPVAQGAKNIFKPFGTGFKTATSQGAGFFESLGKGFKSQGLSSYFKTASKASTAYANSLTKIGQAQNYLIRNGSNALNVIKSSGASTLSSLKSTGSSAVKTITSKTTDMFGAFGKGFTRARSAGDGFFKSLIRGFKGGSMTLGTVQKGVRGVGTVKAGISSARAGLAARGGIKGLAKAADAKALVGFTKTLSAGKSGLKLATGGIKGLFKAISTAGKSFPPLAIALAAIDGIIGGFMGFSRTAGRFEKDFGELNAGMYASSTVAGVLVGILDGLTFGLLNFSGVGRALEDYLAYSINTIMGLFYGMVDGIKAAFSLVSNAFSGIGEQFARIGQTVLGAFNKIFGIFGVQADSMGGMFAILYDVMKAIGKPIGFIIGLPLAATFFVLGKAISLLIVPIEILANLISAAVDVVVGFSKAIYGLLTFDFDMIGAGFKQIFGGLYDAVAGTIGPIVNWVSGVFTGLYDIVAGTVGPALDWLKWAFGGIYAFIAPIVVAIGTVISTVFGAIYKTVSYIANAIASVISTVLSPIVNLVSGVFTGIYNTIAKTLGGIVDWFSWLWKTLVGGSIVPDMVTGIINWFLKLPQKIFSALMTIPKMIGNVFSNIGSYLSSFGTESYFGTLMSQIGNVFSFIGSTISNVVGALQGVFNIFYGIATLDFGKIWEGIVGIGAAIGNQIKDIGKFLYAGIKNSVSYLFKVLKRIPATIFRVLKSTFIAFPKWLLGKVMDVAYLFGTFLARIPEMLYKGIVKTIKRIGEFLYNAFMWPFRKIAEFATFIYDKVVGLLNKTLEFFMDIPGHVGAGISALWEGLSGLGGMILDGLAGLGGMILGGLKSVFVDFPSWLLSSIISGLGNLGGMILGGLKSVFVDFPSWLLSNMISGLGNLGGMLADGIKSAFSSIGNIASSIGQSILDGIYNVFVGFPTWLYDQFTGALSGVWDYIKSWIPGMGAIDGYNESSVAQEATRLQEGNSMLHAGGAAVGGVGDILTGDFSEGASKVGGAIKEGVYAAGETISDAANGAWEGAKAVGSYLNPFNYFNEGTRQIQQTGLAMLHEGEMVVPKNITNMVAEGNGVFPSLSSAFSGVFAGLGDMLTNPLGTAKNTLGGIKNMSSMFSNVIDPLGIGKITGDMLTNPLGTAKNDLGGIENISSMFSNVIDPLGIGKIAGDILTDPLGTAKNALGGIKNLFSNKEPNEIASKELPSTIVQKHGTMPVLIMNWSEIANAMGIKEPSAPEISLGKILENIGPQIMSPLGLLESIGLPGIGNIGSAISYFGNEPETATPLDMQPAPLTDVGQSIVKERTSSQAGVGKLQSDELTRMEEASNKQVSELEQINQGIQDLVGFMRPTGGGATESSSSDAIIGDTKNTRVPRNSPIFGTMKYGYASGGPNRQIINDGK